MYKFLIPNNTGLSTNIEFETVNNIVIVGANGSGKTRFGAQIEQLNIESHTVHRISAQKALRIPDYVQIKSLEKAEVELLYAEYYDISSGKSRARLRGRWQSDLTGSLLDDYGYVLSLLFAKSSERDRLHTIQTRTEQKYIPVPDAPGDIIIKLWTELLPLRNISLVDGKVAVTTPNGKTYHGKDMSDGERVILYLLAQCLCLPENSIIIIDEPEIHIHKSIINKLWDKIEQACPDKLFVYITHDLEFASSRIEARKIWIKEYLEVNKWEWEELQENEDLPENLLIEILGNRKQVIFCEGEKSSHDNTIYQLVYPDFHIIPRGGGDKVIEATKAMNDNNLMHHLKAYGFIDSDYKEDTEKNALLGHNIYTLPVAEIENLFCLEPILRIVAHHLGLDPDGKVAEVTKFLMEQLTKEFELQVTNKAAKIVEYKLGAFSKKAPNKTGISDGIKETLSNIDVDLIYSESEQLFQNAIDEANLSKILLLYNRKSLVDQISSIFGLGKKEYSNLVIRLLKGEKQNEIVTAMKVHLPSL